MKSVVREISPLSQGDCFCISTYSSNDFNQSFHHHNTIELALVSNAVGVKRIVGSQEDVIATGQELVMIPPGLAHGWQAVSEIPNDLSVIVIHFDSDLLNEKFLNRAPLKGLKQMLTDLNRGILFQPEIVKDIAPLISNLTRADNLDSVIQLLSILHQLSLAKYRQIIPEDQGCKIISMGGDKIDEIYAYMIAHHHYRLTPDEVAEATGIKPALLTKFIRTSTGLSFTESLNNIRLKQVIRMLVETTHTVAEIAFACGFNSLANFNRLFRNSHGCTPVEYRQNYFAYRHVKL